MKKIIITSLKGVLIFTLICGVLYTSVVTVIGQAFFSDKANGSLITKEIDGQKVTVGSSLIGQSFTEDKYLHGRPQEVSQLSPVSDEQKELVSGRVEEVGKNVPVDLVTASASGVDPHISFASALFQVERIAKIRGLSEEDVKKVITDHTEGGLIGGTTDKRVNVLEVNLSLDDMT